MTPLSTTAGKRSPFDWSIRLILAAAAAVAGYFAVTHAAASALASSAVEQAHWLAPDDAQILAKLAHKQFVNEIAANEGTPIGSERRGRLTAAAAKARIALSRDPTAVEAAATLGLLSQIDNDGTRARRWFRYAEKLSRRDLPTQLWLIEDAAGRDDIAGTLVHYDIALRTKTGASDLLFPVLASASADPTIASALVTTLAREPIWSRGFLIYLVRNTTTPEATAHLLIALRRRDVPIDDWTSNTLVDVLLAADLNDVAWDYYTILRPGGDRRHSRDPDFVLNHSRPSQLDWVPAHADSGMSASIQPGGSGGLFDFAAPPSVGGPLLRQFQLLPPGDYIIEGISASIDQPKDSTPYWALICTSNGHELGRVAVPNSAVDEGRFFGALTVPANCPAQSLRLIARGSDAFGGLSGQIERVQLRPAN